MSASRFLLIMLALLLAAPAVPAHPVPAQNHDRTLLVRLTPDTVAITYRLELDATWAKWELSQIAELEGERTRVRDEAEVYALYRRFHTAPIANNLIARLDGKPLTLKSATGWEQ